MDSFILCKQRFTNYLHRILEKVNKSFACNVLHEEYGSERLVKIGIVFMNQRNFLKRMKLFLNDAVLRKM